MVVKLARGPTVSPSGSCLDLRSGKTLVLLDAVEALLRAGEDNFAVLHEAD